jgi:peptide-methionine (R)-S-oxide reductase
MTKQVINKNDVAGHLTMQRRQFAGLIVAAAGMAMLGLHKAVAAGATIVKTDEEWKRMLTPEQYQVLREEGTERPFSSPLNNEKRKGTFVCAACDQPLFSSAQKYDSGTGWPSFFDTIAGNVATKTDYKMVVPRTEYHCARCGGHQGHIFEDGPKPTGLRYCNNGVALTFVPDEK